MIHGFGDSGITSWTDVSKTNNFHPFPLLSIYSLWRIDNYKSPLICRKLYKGSLELPPLSLPSFCHLYSRNCLKSRKRQEKGHHCTLSVLLLKPDQKTMSIPCFLPFCSNRPRFLTLWSGGISGIYCCLPQIFYKG